MRQALAAALLAGLGLVVGCAPGLKNLSPQRSPADRMKELLNDSDGSGVITEEDRIWLDEEPQHLNPQRIHGGIQ